MVDEGSLTTSHGYLDSLLEQTRRLVDDVAGLQEELRSLTVTASSPDHLVTVVVSPPGRLVDLEIDPRVYRDPNSAALAAAIRSVIERAQAEVARREAEIRARAMPAAAELGSSVGLDMTELTEIFKPLSATEG
jgi:DNA-binding protein YbaB